MINVGDKVRVYTPCYIRDGYVIKCHSDHTLTIQPIKHPAKTATPKPISAHIKQCRRLVR